MVWDERPKIVKDLSIERVLVEFVVDGRPLIREYKRDALLKHPELAEIVGVFIGIFDSGDLVTYYIGSASPELMKQLKVSMEDWIEEAKRK